MYETIDLLQQTTDYYYIDLIINFTNSTPIGLLYILYEN